MVQGGTRWYKVVQGGTRCKVVQVLAHLLVQEETVDPLDVLDGDLGALPLDGHQVGHRDQLDGVPGQVGFI